MVVFFLVGILVSCQSTRPIKDQPSENKVVPSLPPGDSWFASARLGDWAQFEQLQKDLDRQWDYQPGTGLTALMTAARNGHIDFVKKLLKKKIKINLTDKYNYNALSYALHGPRPLEIKKQMCLLLVENGADPFSEDHLKLSPILIMIENSLLECIQAVRFSDFKPCDKAQRLSEVTSLVTYAEKEEELSIRDYLKSQGCQ